MKLIACWLLFFAVSLRADSIQGDVKLKYAEWGSGENAFKKEFGKVVKVTTIWHAGEFFGAETVFAGATVKNTGTKPMFFNYYVAFYDKDKNLVGVAGQGPFGDDGLKPGEETQLGSCLIRLPRDKYKEITSYQAVLYESDTRRETK